MLKGLAALSGLTAAGTVVSQGPDLAGIALIITAISGLIATIGGLILALRRKPMDARDAALLAIAERLTHTEDEQP